MTTRPPGIGLNVAVFGGNRRALRFSSCTLSRARARVSPEQVSTCCAVLERSIRVRVCFRGKPVVPWNAGQSFVQASLFGRRHVVAKDLQENDRESDQGPAALLDLFASHCDQAVEEFPEPNGMRIIRHRIGSTSALSIPGLSPSLSEPV